MKTSCSSEDSFPSMKYSRGNRNLYRNLIYILKNEVNVFGRKINGGRKIFVAVVPRVGLHAARPSVTFRQECRAHPMPENNNSHPGGRENEKCVRFYRADLVKVIISLWILSFRRNEGNRLWSCGQCTSVFANWS